MTIRPTNLLQYFLILVTAAAFALSFGFKMSAPFAYCAMAAYLLYLLATTIENPAFSAIFYVFIFGQVGSLVGSSLIENGAYVYEQLRVGYSTGATVRLAFFSILFLTILKGLSSPLLQSSLVNPPTPTPVKKWEHVAVNVVTAIIALCLVIIVVKHGTPLSHGMDRFRFWADVAPAGKRFTGLAIQAAFLNGVLYARTQEPDKKRNYLLNLLILLVLQVFQGVKFSGLHLSAYLFIFPSLLTVANKNLSTRVRKSLIYLSVFIVSVLAIIVMQYKTLYRGNPLAAMGSRVVQQGHVWWGIDNVSRRFGDTSISGFLREFDPTARTKREPVGLVNLMWAVSPPQIVESYLRKGAYFSMGYPAVLVYYLGYTWGIVAHAAAAGMAFFLTWLLIRMSLFKNIVMALLGVRLFLQGIDSLIMGNLFLLLDFKTILYALLLCLLFVGEKLTTEKEGRFLVSGT